MNTPHPVLPPRRLPADTGFALPDPAVMPPEQCALAVAESWLGRVDSAVRRVLDHGLPSSALFDWIMDCGLVHHQRLSDPARRDVNIPRKEWDVVAVILARGGSRGVPRKALRAVDGIPLIARSIGACRTAGCLTRVMVNTDCPDIAAAARAAGADVPFLRPAELATDQAHPLDAWVFTRAWMLLVERRVPDFLLSVSATHPCLQPDEMQRALDRLAAANRPSLQTVARLPAVSLEFLTMHQGMGTPLPDENGAKDDTRARDGERFLQCGAFSITSNRPYYHVEPWFRQYMTDVPAPPAEPLAHILSARQGVDIDEPWDLAACRLLLDGDDPFPPCTPEDVAAHRPAGNKGSGSQSGAPAPTGRSGMATPAALVCVVALPPEERESLSGSEHAGAPDGPYLHLAGVPAPCRVLDAVRMALPGATLAICGEGSMARAVARRYELPLLPPPDFLSDLRADSPTDRDAAWPVPLLTGDNLAASAPVGAWLADLDGLGEKDEGGGPGRDILCIDGRAALLDAATLRAFLDTARAAAPADACRLPVCSVSPAPVHPVHLKRVDEAGSVLSAPGVPARRQDLPKVWHRDGALTLLRGRSTDTTGTTGATGSGCDTAAPDAPAPGEARSLGYRPVPIGRAQATLAVSRLDAARGMALAAHDGHPDLPPSGDHHQHARTEPA